MALAWEPMILHGLSRPFANFHGLSRRCHGIAMDFHGNATWVFVRAPTAMTMTHETFHGIATALPLPGYDTTMSLPLHRHCQAMALP